MGLDGRCLYVIVRSLQRANSLTANLLVGESSFGILLSLTSRLYAEIIEHTDCL